MCRPKVRGQKALISLQASRCPKVVPNKDLVGGDRGHIMWGRPLVTHGYCIWQGATAVFRVQGFGGDENPACSVGCYALGPICILIYWGLTGL